MNPFAKPTPKKPAQPPKPVQKNDSTRENVKRQLINALDKMKDSSCKGLKITSEQIAKEIEEEIYKQNDNSSQKREYRDKIRKLEMRLKGSRNNFIRETIKKGKISVVDFCNLNEKDLMDDNYFKKLEGDEIEEKNEQKNINNNETKNKTNFPPNKRIVMAKPPALRNFKIPKPSPPVIPEQNKEINNINNNNISSNKDDQQQKEDEKIISDNSQNINKPIKASNINNNIFNINTEEVKKKEIINNNFDDVNNKPKIEQIHNINNISENINNFDNFSNTHNIDNKNNIDNGVEINNMIVLDNPNDIDVQISSNKIENKDNSNNLTTQENNIVTESNIIKNTDIEPSKVDSDIKNENKNEVTPKSSFDLLQEKLNSMTKSKKEEKKKKPKKKKKDKEKDTKENKETIHKKKTKKEDNEDTKKE